jgi:uncharacterized protein YdhG (YjbR/CyaY superfamily)
VTTGEDAAVRVDAYIAATPDATREGLRRLRALVAAAAPEAVETFSYRMPAFKYRGRPLVYVGATANHYALYGGIAGAMAAMGDELKGYDTSKGTLRFPAGSPPPEALVRKLVQLRIAEIDAAEAARKERKRGNQKSAG